MDICYKNLFQQPNRTNKVVCKIGDIYELTSVLSERAQASEINKAAL